MGFNRFLTSRLSVRRVSAECFDHPLLVGRYRFLPRRYATAALQARIIRNQPRSIRSFLLRGNAVLLTVYRKTGILSIPICRNACFPLYARALPASASVIPKKAARSASPLRQSSSALPAAKDRRPVQGNTAPPRKRIPGIKQKYYSPGSKARLCPYRRL